MANPWFETVAEAQRRAKRRLPKGVYGALVAGSEKGLTAADNVAAFDEIGFAPHTAGLANDKRMGTTVMGQEVSLPVLISPTGVQAVHPDGEVAVARAAAARGVAIGLSSFASKPIEEVVAANPQTFFQMYWVGSREEMLARMERARRAGAVGMIATRVGPLMGAFDIFEIVATGKGAHAAMPNTGKDPMLFAAHAIGALQTIVARNLHPLEAGVVSVTQVHGGDTWNVIPEEVVLRGTARSFDGQVQDLIEHRIRTIVAGVAAMFEMSATVRYERRYPATVNAATETGHALAAASAVVGAANVDADPTPNMGSEDFAFMLNAKPGCYVWLGAGRGPQTPNVHNPHYDFNDDALPIGTSYWVTLVGQQLGV